MNNNKEAILSFGRRKTSFAHLKLYKFKGKQEINGISKDAYFKNEEYFINKINKPFLLIGLKNSEIQNWKLFCTLKGGGKNSQAEAFQLAFAKALIKVDPKYKKIFSFDKNNDILKQDVRQKERRKYGLKKARKAPQFSKR